ncbi:MAG: hypothetical protein ACKVOE_10500 [Rickettsiales bacterium]
MNEAQLQSDLTENADDASREPIRAPEASHASHGAPNTAHVVSTGRGVARPEVNDAPATAKPMSSFGEFLYRHRAATKNPVIHLGYQIFRNVAAAVPYGIATAAVWEGFERVARATAKAEAGSMGNTINRFARSPIRDITMIAAGFTLYRGTLKYVRYMKEHLFNPDYSPEQADYAARHVGSTALSTLKEIAPAEINSTPYGAIALGLGRRYLDGIKDYQARLPADKIAATTLGGTGAQPRMLRFTKDGKFWPHLSNVGEFFHKIGGKGSRVWTEAGVFILSFLTFFEVSDRLYKDVQVRRGVWNGEQNSLARLTPEKNAIIEAQRTEDSPERQHAGQHTETFGKSDPNLLRLGFTRILPTILGISAYAFTKRASYLAMGHFTGKDTFWKRAFVEGAATSTFFVMTTANDVFEGVWKKMFEPQAPAVELSQHQQQKYEALLDRVNEKEMGAGRAA